MPNYKVKGTDLLHNKKLYPENSTIELTEAQAKMLADYLELIPAIQKQQQKPAKENNKKTEAPKEPEKRAEPVKENDGGEN